MPAGAERLAGPETRPDVLQPGLVRARRGEEVPPDVAETLGAELAQDLEPVGPDLRLPAGHPAHGHPAVPQDSRKAVDDPARRPGADVRQRRETDQAARLVRSLAGGHAGDAVVPDGR